MRFQTALILLALTASRSADRTESEVSGRTPTDGLDQTEKILVISKGDRFEKRDYLIPSHVVILDFYADW